MSIKNLNAEEPIRDRSDESESSIASKALISTALFKGCGLSFTDAIVEQAPRFDLKVEEEVDPHLKDGGPLCIVEKGALRIAVGAGPGVIMGPGTVLNCPGFLGVLGEADAYRPRREVDEKVQPKGNRGRIDPGADSSPPYSLIANPTAAPPTLFTDRKKAPVNDKKAPRLNNEEVCFFNLCPHAAVVGTTTRRGGGWMPLKASGAAAGLTPLQGEACHTSATKAYGGAKLIVIPTSLVESVGRRQDCRDSFERFRENGVWLKRVWRIVLRRCGIILPSVPPQILWSVTEMSSYEQIPVGQFIVEENDVGDDAESIKIVDEGEAVVMKLVGVTPTKAENVDIGKLGPGAIIGDVCLMGAHLPRSASVQTHTPTQVLTIPMPGVVDLMRYYPGMLGGMGSRLRAISGFLQTTLPVCSEVLSSMNLFAACEDSFLRALSGDRRAFFGGHVFDSEEDANGMVYAVEYGRCGVEVAGRGVLADLPTGKCFGVGEPALIGNGEITHKAAVVRVVTPIAIVLQISKKNLCTVFERFQAEKQRFERMSSQQDGGCRGGMSEKIEVFRDCSPGFIDTIFGALEMKCYMPGHTIVVMGAQDASQMFILKSGTVRLDKDGETVGQMTTGAAFGELVMLGVMRRRTITVRAATMCFTMEIPRATFLKAIERFPDERPRFEQLAVKRMDMDSAVIWPVLKGFPDKLLLHVNLHAERRMCASQDPFLATQAMKEAAVLLLQGSAGIMNAAGEEVQPLNPGECFNEQILLGYANSRGEYVLPKALCEMQILTKQAWDKVLDEFKELFKSKEEKEKYEQLVHDVGKMIYKHMAGRAEFRLGVVPGSTTMLKSSALFRGTSSPFVEACRDRLKNALYKPGKLIIEAGKDGDGFYLLLEGTAQATLRDWTFDLSSGAIFGEAVLIGIVKAFQKTVRASTLCMVQKLRKADFRECLFETFPNSKQFVHLVDQRYFEIPFVEAEKEFHASLPSRVRTSLTFQHCNTEFLDVICHHIDDAFFMPHEILLKAGDEFILGESFVYLLLAGQAVAEDNLGVTLGVINVGEIIGESTLVGMSAGTRTANVRAWSKGLVHCASIPSGTLHDALNKFPKEKETLVNLSRRRHARNEELIARRSMWLNEVALPTLRKSCIFSWCRPELIMPIAAHLAETIYEPGEVIAEAGEKANSMIVLLEGVADIVSKCGMTVGSLTDGAVVGEVAVMGIFSTRTATVRAFHKCRVIQLTSEVLGRTSADAIKQRITELGQCRHVQVRHGLPLSALPLGIPAEDVCVRAVALQSERIDLEPGDCLQPLSDRSPCGPHFGVLGRGRANLEMANGSVAMALTSGGLVLEGLAADFNALLRAKAPCEYYRVKRSDFMVAVLSVSTAHEWFYRFRLMERETRDRFNLRLRSAMGALEAGTRRSASTPGRVLGPGDTQRTPTQDTTRLLGDTSDFAMSNQRPGTAPDRNRSNRNNNAASRTLELPSNRNNNAASRTLELPFGKAISQVERERDEPLSGSRAGSKNRPRQISALGQALAADGLRPKPSERNSLQRAGSAPGLRGTQRGLGCKSQALSKDQMFLDGKPSITAAWG